MTLAATSVRALGALSAGMLALGMLAACTPPPEPKPTKTALFASDEEAFKAAEETYRAYTDALNHVDTSDPKTFEPVYAFSTGSFLSGDKKNFSWMHAERLTLGGTARVIGFTGVGAEDNRRTVQAKVCLDVTSVTLVDSEGKSQVNPSRPDNYVINVTFQAQSDKLKIASALTPEDQTCAR